MAGRFLPWAGWWEGAEGGGSEAQDQAGEHVLRTSLAVQTLLQRKQEGVAAMGRTVQWAVGK